MLIISCARLDLVPIQWSRRVGPEHSHYLHICYDILYGRLIHFSADELAKGVLEEIGSTAASMCFGINVNIIIKILIYMIQHRQVNGSAVTLLN